MMMCQIATKNDFDSLDIVFLEEIAEQCPQDGGMAVLQARIHLFPYTGLKYVNDCELEGWEYGEGERRVNLALKNKSTDQASALIYPNPVNSELYIELLNCENAQLKLFDIGGRLCKSQDLQVYSKLDLSELANGLYIYKIKSKEGLIKAGKLVISK